MGAIPPLRSDAFVFFGGTGDLAYRKIFPALQALSRRGRLEMPVIGIGRQHGGLDRDAFHKLCTQLKYVDGDYRDAATLAVHARALHGA